MMNFKCGNFDVLRFPYRLLLHVRELYPCAPRLRQLAYSIALAQSLWQHSWWCVSERFTTPSASTAEEVTLEHLAVVVEIVILYNTSPRWINNSGGPILDLWPFQLIRHDMPVRNCQLGKKC